VEFGVNKTFPLVCVCFHGGGGRRCFFVFVSRVSRVGEWMGERVTDFFHSSQNGDL